MLVFLFSFCPNINGVFYNRSFANESTNGLFGSGGAFSELDQSFSPAVGYSPVQNASNFIRGFTFDANKSNALYGGSSTVQSKANQALIIIRA